MTFVAGPVSDASATSRTGFEDVYQSVTRPMIAPPMAPAARATVTPCEISIIGIKIADAIVKMIGGTRSATRKIIAGLPPVKKRVARITMIEITRPRVESDSGNITAVAVMSSEPVTRFESSFGSIVRPIAIAATIAATIDS